MSSMLFQLLDRITMYRLMLYSLLAIWGSAIILSQVGLLSYDPYRIFISGILLGITCYAANWILSKAFNAVTNLESAGITALILTLITGPFRFPDQIGIAMLLGVLAMATKYIIVFRNRHIFNPAAISALIAGLALGQGATWWIGSQYSFPIVILLGALIITKIKRWQLVLTFIGIYFGYSILTQSFALDSLRFSPVWFFAAIMLTEPLTSPAFKRGQIAFGALVALTIIGIQEFFPRYPYAIETSLILGNLVAYIWTPTTNVRLKLLKIIQESPGVWAIEFDMPEKFTFAPGQYIELTLPHPKSDSRGIRRYFTIASSPDQAKIVISTKTAEPSSSFKNTLTNLNKNQAIMASGPYGDFVLPREQSSPVAFIAGGIGITPFLSMVSHLENAQSPADINLLYLNHQQAHIPFKEQLSKINLAHFTVNYATSPDDDKDIQKLITDKIPDYRHRIFYISGPHAMVNRYVKVLRQLQVAGIKTDFFPGY